MLKRLLGVTLLLVLASNLCWAQYRFNGTFYQLRWGQAEGSEDLITPVNALGNPLCVKMGTGWSAYLDGVGNLLGWKVSYARLRSLVDGTVYFTVNDPGVGNLKPPGQPYPLPNLPAHVDHAQLEISYVMYYWGAWSPTYYLTPIYSSEVFIVLDMRKAPMNPAWGSMWRYSCGWAHETNNFYDASRSITLGVFFQRPGFAYPSNTATYWLLPPDYTVFRLKVLLDAWNTGLWTSGNCVDVSCLTMLALCSVGIDFSTRMLTQTASGNFTTNPLCAIGSDPTRDDTYSLWTWAWHQICIPTGDIDPPSNQARVWDPTGAHKEDMSGNGYRNPPAHHPTHFWHQKDYWQKPHTQLPDAWLGLVGAPIQTSNDPQLYGYGTWKCSVTTL